MTKSCPALLIGTLKEYDCLDDRACFVIDKEIENVQKIINDAYSMIHKKPFNGPDVVSELTFKKFHQNLAGSLLMNYFINHKYSTTFFLYVFLKEDMLHCDYDPALNFPFRVSLSDQEYIYQFQPLFRSVPEHVFQISLPKKKKNIKTIEDIDNENFYKHFIKASEA